MTSGAHLVLGADGGNSKTIVAVADEAGRILGSARGGPSDIYGRGAPEAALGVLVDTARAALGEAGAKPADVGANVWCLAGADWFEDMEFISGELRKQLAPAWEPTVLNDAFGGLRSGAPELVGIGIVCGTFNAVCARSTDGRSFHLGFWPDRAGGFDLGLEALNAAYRHGLDLGPPTAITERALSLFGAKDPLDLMHLFTRREGRLPLWRAQQLAPIVLDLADAGDPVALAIAREMGRRLGEQARVSAARVELELEGARVVLSGGVLSHPTRVIEDAILERLPGAVPVRTSAPPVVGALLLAFDVVGVPMEADRLARQLADR